MRWHAKEDSISPSGPGRRASPSDGLDRYRGSQEGPEGTIEESDPEALARAMSVCLEESKQNTLRYAFQEVDEEKKKG